MTRIGVLSFASYLIFAIPLDIACAKRADSMQLPYDMNFIWMAINFSICLVLMFVLPMAMILYSDDSENFMDSVKFAAKVSAAVALFHIVCVTLYAVIIQNAHIPARHVIKSTIDFLPSKDWTTGQQALDFYYTTTNESSFIKVKLGILNCCTLHLTVIGSFLLVFLGGYGLALFPMEFLNAFLNRPQIVNDLNFSEMPKTTS